MRRREFLLAPLSFVALGSLSLSAYAGVIEPLLLTRVTTYTLDPSTWKRKTWPDGLNLSIAVISDLHACDPWMSLQRIETIVATTNALNADLVVLLGDYVAGHNKITGIVPDKAWAKVLSGLRAPLGVYAVLGNHDWWADHDVQIRQEGYPAAGIALQEAGIPVLENGNLRLEKDGHSFWLAGLADQLAFLSRSGQNNTGQKWSIKGRDDMSLALRDVPQDAPVILLAHEPDIFPRVPDRVSLTLSGHTHGGQVRLFGMAPYAPSRLSKKYCYGLFEEDGKHLIVSGGLGCSWWPIRFGAPPEIVHINIGTPHVLSSATSHFSVASATRAKQAIGP